MGQTGSRSTLSAASWLEERIEAEWHSLADWLRSRSGSSERARNESWDRSDTDGFLSQWAHGQMSQRYLGDAAIADQLGLATFPALYDLATGEPLPTIYVMGGYQRMVWGVCDAWGGRATRWINPSRASTPERQQAHYRKHGVTEGTILGRYIGLDQPARAHGILPLVADLHADEIALRDLQSA